MLLAAFAACTPLEVMFDRPAHAPVVVASPPPPAPHAPYAGPLPSQIAFDLSPFELPLRTGAVGPIDTSLGALQYPFACDTETSDLGQPEVDNEAGLGTAVFALDRDGEKSEQVAGYSKDCLVRTRAEYYYKPADSERLRPLPPTGVPEDAELIERNGVSIPFVVRLERGTLNRFIYAIAVLADTDDDLDRPNGRYWNGRLVYYFRGGVGIGHRQGEVRPSTVTARRLGDLAKGYAVAFSSGTQTGNHYKVWLAANTATMVKAQFAALYGAPQFTIGIGESGGAVQQWLIAQNRPGVLDALIPVYSYPDMITQTIWALDCELLEYYFDVTAADQKRWRVQEQRTLVLGLAADSNAKNPYADLDSFAQLVAFRLPRLAKGATECSKSWRGLTPLVNNPLYTNHPERYTPEVHAATHFSHWDDLALFYGIGDDGHAFRTYDNVGVQYGLEALRKGELTPAEFLHLNANVGGWKPPAAHAPERFWRLSGDDDLRRVSLWSDHNMMKAPGGANPLSAFETADSVAVHVAPRSAGNPGAIGAAYWSGHVFLGGVDLPVLDVRHYLDPELDMHHSFASFSTRLRIERVLGKHNNHVIWMSDPTFDPSPLALATIDAWLTGGSRPVAAEDTCFAAGGQQIARGKHVWDGPWNSAPETGPCLARYPPYKSPRNVAGSPLAGDLFKCALVDVATAVERRVYAPMDMHPHLAMLAKVFPDGVCDFTVPDVGRPAGLTNSASP